MKIYEITHAIRILTLENQTKSQISPYVGVARMIDLTVKNLRRFRDGKCFFHFVAISSSFFIAATITPTTDVTVTFHPPTRVSNKRST